MNETTEHGIRCPSCDEHVTVLIDLSVAEQQYVEDCEVCCRPMLLDVSVSGDRIASVSVRAENA